MPSPKLLCLVSLLFVSSLFASEVIPPKPAKYFNDYAGVVSQEAASRFNADLEQFERDTSNQVVVVVIPKMQSDSDIADYTQRVAQNWGVGQKDRNNGVVFFIFPQDRKMFIQTGYGTEGAIPDATAFDITERHVKPRFRANDFQGGIAVGIALIEKALQGEYKGSGRTLAEGNSGNGSGWPLLIFILFFIIVFIMVNRAARRSGGYRYSRRGGPYYTGWNTGGWGGGGSGGGWSSGGGGGGFSGGGGSFGGGGAGSSW